MNRWLNNIFLLFLSFVLLNSNIFGLPAPTPSAQINSLEDIKFKNFIPKVTLHSLQHDFSLFETYLNSHTIPIELNKKTLSWEVVIPNREKHPTLITVYINNEQEEFTLTQPGNLKSHKLSIENVKNILFTNNFLQDVIDSMQKNNEYKQIHAIFYPDNNICVNALETQLNNSLEFKVLSQTSTDYPKNKLSRTLVDKKAAIKLCDSYLQKEKAILKPKLHLYAVRLQDFESQELLKKSSSIITKWQKQNVDKITLPKIGLPTIISNEYNEYTYIPNMKHPSMVVCFSSINALEKKSLKRYFSPLSNNIYTSLFSLNSMDFNNKDYIHTPKKASILTTLSIPTSILREKNSNPQTRNMLPTIEKLLTINNSIPLKQIEKYIFTNLDFSLPDELTYFPINSINLEKNKTQKISLPDKEENIIYTLRELSLALQTLNEEYAFSSNQIKKIPSSKIIAKKIPGIYITKNLDDNIFLREVDFYFDSFDIDSKKLSLPNYLNHTAIVSNESINQKIITNKNLLQKKNTYPQTPVASEYPLNNDKEILLKDTYIGKLDAEAQINKEGLTKQEGYEFLCFQHPLKFTQHKCSKNNNQLVIFSANKEPHLLAYEQFSNNGNYSSKTRSTHKSFYPYFANLNKTLVAKDITKPTDAITTDKQLIDICNPIIFASDEITINQNPILCKKDYATKVTPLQTKKIFLDQHIYIENIQLDQTISLPKLTSINNKTSFFLNPLLSLINTNTFDIERDFADDASKTNRDMRMTQYSLFNWPTLEDLGTDSFPEAFAIDTRVLSNKNENSKDFAYTIKTYEKDLIEPLPIHMLYILDTSSTIEAHRFKIFKESIIKSISYLEPNARFNIAILKKGKIQMLHENSVFPTISSKSYVKRHLKNITQGKSIGFQDLTSLIQKEKYIASTDVTHRLCILLSDGKFSNNIRVDQDHLNKITNDNVGNFSLYTASVSDKNNKAMLSLLAKLNHGFSLYTRTHASFSRKFATLVKHIQHPLIHDIMITFPDDEDAKVYLEKKVSPILLADKGLTFYGKNSTKPSSRVFIQGKCGDRWINILKEIPNTNIRRGRYTYQRKFANQKSFLSLYSFLKTKDEKYLTNAKKHTSSYDLPLPIP